MPQRRNSSEPPKVMTWGRALPVLIIALLFDALRLLFEWFWFFGPALATLYCTAKVNGVLQTWTAGVLGAKTAALACSAAVIGAVAGATVITGGASAAAIEIFGTVMAMAVGLLGWLTVGAIMLAINGRIFKENFLWFVVSLLISEVPLVGSIPAITIAVWRMYSKQIGTEKAAFAQWEKEQANIRLQERNLQVLQIMQIQAAQQQAAQEELAAEEQEQEAEAQEAEEEQAEEEAQEVANEDTYPAVRKAA